MIYFEPNNPTNTHESASLRYQRSITTTQDVKSLHKQRSFKGMSNKMLLNLAVDTIILKATVV